MKLIKFCFVIALALLLGYFVFADKSLIFGSLKKRFLDLDLPELTSEAREPKEQDMDSVSTPAINDKATDYSKRDRERLDSILEEANH